MIYGCFKRSEGRQATKKGVKITFQIFIIFDIQKKEKKFNEIPVLPFIFVITKKGIE